MTEIIRTSTTVDSALEETFLDLAGQLAPRSRITYRSDAKHFATWLHSSGLTLATLTRSDIIRYRQDLAASYAKVTATRMLAVAKRLCDEAVKRGFLAASPAVDVKGFRGTNDETTHTVLKKEQALAILNGIDRSTALGKRDYALIMLLLRTGLRRSEAAALTLADIRDDQGHTVALIRHGKGDKRRKAKIPVDTRRVITEYVLATGRTLSETAEPLFVSFRKGDHPTKAALSDDGIEGIVKARAKAAGIDLTPHGLRASFITLTLEGGAKLQQVQYAAGHADPRTTERYQKRKTNLDDNAVDYLRL